MSKFRNGFINVQIGLALFTDGASDNHIELAITGLNENIGGFISLQDGAECCDQPCAQSHDRWIGNHHLNPEGALLMQSQWLQQQHAWLPSDADRSYVKSLMGRVTEPGKFANWIAPPARGINNLAVDFEYVRFN